MLKNLFIRVLIYVLFFNKEMISCVLHRYDHIFLIFFPILLYLAKAINYIEFLVNTSTNRDKENSLENSLMDLIYQL